MTEKSENRISYTESVRKLDGGLISITLDATFSPGDERAAFEKIRSKVQEFLATCKK